MRIHRSVALTIALCAARIAILADAPVYPDAAAGDPVALGWMRCAAR